MINLAAIVKYKLQKKMGGQNETAVDQKDQDL